MKEKLWAFVLGSIDCAGILKLRNSDIELRKGETDIGRKNTRVRLVFRVHVPQPSGRTLSLQVASNPIECCKWTPARCRGRKPSVSHMLSLSFPLSAFRLCRLGTELFPQTHHSVWPCGV